MTRRAESSGGQSAWRRYGPNAALAIIAIVLVALSFETGRQAGMAT